MKRQIITWAAVLALAPMAIATRSVASPAQHDAASHAQAQDTPKAEMRQQMMAKMGTPDAELERLVAAMNAATGDAKVAAMADLITRIAQRQTTMRDMQESMKTMMAQCPMMKDAGAHDEHKP